MRHIKHHGRSGVTHLGQAGHVGHQIVIAKADTTLTGQKVVFVQACLTGCGTGFVDHVFHVPRRQKLTFFDVDRLTRLGDRTNEIGLAAQKSRGLQHINHTGHGFDLRLIMDIGQHGNVQLPAHFIQDFQTRI